MADEAVSRTLGCRDGQGALQYPAVVALLQSWDLSPEMFQDSLQKVMAADAEVRARQLEYLKAKNG